MGPTALAVCEHESRHRNSRNGHLTYVEYARSLRQFFLFVPTTNHILRWWLAVVNVPIIRDHGHTWMAGKKVDSANPIKKRIAQRVEKLSLAARHMVREPHINSIVGI
jgi:hypothetical protein